MPCGRFLGRLAEERTLEGFTLARLIPTIPKREVRRHQHEEAHFVFVLRGAYETSARPAGGSPGQPLMIYNPPGTTHRDCFAEGDLSRSAFATLSVSAPSLASVEPEVRLPEGATCLAEAAYGLVRQLLVETGGRDNLSDCVAEALCLELLQRTGVERDSAAGGAPAWLRRARELLRDTCLDGGPRSVREIAAVLGVHPVHLARCFRRQFGVNPAEYRRRCRLERARWLLRRSSATLAEIATATGFADQSHFTSAFRRSCGVSPGLFRRS